jgi:two-component system heavy metal sensor histidine kinase CusS
VDEDQQFLLRTLIGLFLAVSLATAIVSRTIGARLAKDVQAIARVAREVESGNLNARVGPAARGSAETLALAKDLDYMIENLGALVTAQRTFISHAAHELRSPLSTLRGELQLALRRPRDAETFRRTIEEVLIDVDALIGLSEGLLTLARVQGPQKRVSQVSTVGDIVADTLRVARGPADVKGIVFEEKPENATFAHLTIQGERGEIVRALRNLVDNAVVHSPAHMPVMIAVQSRANQVEIAIADRGPGVSKEDEPHIFQAFYRGTKEQGDERPGAGLGLAIACGIAKNLGGDIHLDHEWHPGAQFVLVLPIVDLASSGEQNEIVTG